MRSRVARLSVSPLSLPCLPCVSWLRPDAERAQAWISARIYDECEKNLLSRRLFSPATLSVARATRARQGKMHVASESDTNHNRDMPWHVFRDSRYLLHDGHTRIVCNRRFQVFVVVKPNRLGKTRGRNNDFAELIIVPLRELLRVYYLLL